MTTPYYTILQSDATPAGDSARDFYEQGTFREAPPKYEDSQYGGSSPSLPYKSPAGPYELSPCAPPGSSYTPAPPMAPLAASMTPSYVQPMQQAQAQQVQPPQVINVTCMTGGNAIALPMSVSRDSMRLQCPSCRQHIKTNVTRKSVCKTHMCALLLCICLCWPCACLPYCCASYRDAYHSCPNCEAPLGVYRT